MAHAQATPVPDPDSYPFDPYSTPKMATLLDRLRTAESIADYARVFHPKATSPDTHRPHLRYGNKKIDSDVAIFNVGAATDCTHLGEPTCQVDADQCYAHRTEKMYSDGALAFRRRQHVLWTHVTAQQFADAVQYVFDEIKQMEITALRFNQSGDIRTRGEMKKVDEIAAHLDRPVYLYTASSGLDWTETDHVVVNASNDDVEGARGRYDAVQSADDIPDDGVHCPYDHSDGDIGCGQCRICLDDEFERDVYITLH